ncbi:hypothetical protein FB451DRAFT_428818 [Mycena latifolia]|nr:hypothetical protein FB451DRAFT_428818 [Mycena latifolia]
MHRMITLTYVHVALAAPAPLHPPAPPLHSNPQVLGCRAAYSKPKSNAYLLSFTSPNPSHSLPLVLSIIVRYVSRTKTLKAHRREVSRVTRALHSLPPSLRTPTSVVLVETRMYSGPSCRLRLGFNNRAGNFLHLILVEYSAT